MSHTDCILSGTLSLGKDKDSATQVLWQEENTLKDFCLYTDRATESSKIEQIDFQLEATVDYAAVKLFMFERYRWKIGIVEPHSGLRSLLDSLFAEGVNPSGTTKRALIISVLNSVDQLEIHAGSKLLIYGQRVDDKLHPFAHPLHGDDCFMPIYEPSGHLNPEETLTAHQPVLEELFGKDFQLNTSGSSQLNPPTNQLSELELIEVLNDTINDRDVIGEFKSAAEGRKLAMKEKKAVKAEENSQQQTRSNPRLQKSKPNKLNIATHIPSSESAQEERKATVIRLIKSGLSRSASKDDKKICQFIYQSIRHMCEHEFDVTIPLNEDKLAIFIKIHVDFYDNFASIYNYMHRSQ